MVDQYDHEYYTAVRDINLGEPFSFFIDLSKASIIFIVGTDSKILGDLNHQTDSNR